MMISRRKLMSGAAATIAVAALPIVKAPAKSTVVFLETHGKSWTVPEWVPEWEDAAIVERMRLDMINVAGIPARYLFGLVNEDVQIVESYYKSVMRQVEYGS